MSLRHVDNVIICQIINGQMNLIVAPNLTKKNILNVREENTKVISWSTDASQGTRN